MRNYVKRLLKTMLRKTALKFIRKAIIITINTNALFDWFF